MLKIKGVYSVYCKTLNFNKQLIFMQIRKEVVKGGQGQTKC